MACLELLRVQAYFDGELDAGASLDIERHLDSCGECTALLQELKTSCGALRQQGLYRRASPQLRSRIAESLDREQDSRQWLERWIPRQRQFWFGAGTGALATAFASVLAFFLISTDISTPLVADLTTAHLRSLLENHLIDVASSDQHTVKPWFAGHADVSPPAVDFPKEDYRLVGGRLDYVDGKRMPVVVYRHGAHVINVFAWAQRGEAVPSATTRNGYHLVFWQSGDLILCAVSDTAMDDLNGLVRLLQDPTFSPSRE
jgi:anti-sigma factor RsiW